MEGRKATVYTTSALAVLHSGSTPCASREHSAMMHSGSTRVPLGSTQPCCTQGAHGALCVPLRSTRPCRTQGALHMPLRSTRPCCTQGALRVLLGHGWQELHEGRKVQGRHPLSPCITEAHQDQRDVTEHQTLPTGIREAAGKLTEKM